MRVSCHFEAGVLQVYVMNRGCVPRIEHMIFNYSYDYEWDSEYCYPGSNVLNQQAEYSGSWGSDDCWKGSYIDSSGSSFACDYRSIHEMFDRIAAPKEAQKKVIRFFFGRQSKNYLEYL